MAASTQFHRNYSHENTSSVNVSFSDHEYEFGLRQKVLLSVDTIFFLVGFFGNGSIIYLTTTRKELRRIPNLMIANLAVGDMIIVLVNILLNMLAYVLYSARQFLHYACQFILFTQILSQGISVLTLTALSVNRLTAVAFPLVKQSISKKVILWTVIAIWTISLILASPMFANDLETVCLFGDSDSYTAYIMILVICLFILPTITMTVCYVWMTNALVSKNTKLVSQDSRRDSRANRKQQRQRARLAVIVLIMTIVFILCCTPFYVWLMILRFDPTNPFLYNKIVREMMPVLMKINTVFNPVILYSMSSAYRRYIMCKTFQNPGQSQSTRSRASLSTYTERINLNMLSKT